MENGVLGLGIMVELYNGFSKPANQIQQSMATLEGKATNMANALDVSMRGIHTGVGSLFTSLAVASPFGVAIQKARDFEAQLSNIKSLGTTTEELAILEQTAIKAGASTKFSALESANAVEELLKAGIKTTQIIGDGGLTGALDLAVAGGLSLEKASILASDALSLFGSKGSTIRDMANVIASSANASSINVSQFQNSMKQAGGVFAQVGGTMQDFGLAVAVLGKNTLKGEEAGTSLKNMFDALQPTTKDNIALFKQLGLMNERGANAFFDTQGRIKSITEVAGIMQETFSKFNPQHQAKMLRQIFGSDSQRSAGAFVKEGVQGFTALQEAMQKFTIAQMAKDKLDNLSGALELLQGSIETIAIKVGQMFLPALKGVVQITNNVIDAIEPLIDTTLGRYFIMASAGVASFVVVFGGVVPLVQSASSAFVLLGKTALTTAMSFAPYLAIGGVIALGVEALSSFRKVITDVEKPTNGLYGALQSVGGVIWSIGNAISTWNGKEFNLGGNEAKLQALGLLDTVLSLSTYAVRFYEFGKGVANGLYGVFEGVRQVLGVVSSAFSSFVNSLSNSKGAFFGLSDNIEKWNDAGQKFGYLFGILGVTALTALTASAISFAGAMLVANAPIIAIAGAIGAIVYAVYNWEKVTKFFSDVWNNAMIFAQSAINNIVLYFQKDFSRDVSSVLIQFAQYAPKYFQYAFDAFLGVVSWAFTNLLPIVSSAISNIAYWTVTTGVPMLISGLFSFGSWAIQNIPYMLGSAVLAGVVGMSRMLYFSVESLAKFGWDLAKGIGDNMLKGLQGIRDTILSWWNGLVSSLGFDNLKANIDSKRSSLEILAKTPVNERQGIGARALIDSANLEAQRSFNMPSFNFENLTKEFAQPIAPNTFESVQERLMPKNMAQNQSLDKEFASIRAGVEMEKTETILQNISQKIDALIQATLQSSSNKNSFSFSLDGEQLTSNINQINDMRESRR